MMAFYIWGILIIIEAFEATLQFDLTSYEL